MKSLPFICLISLICSIIFLSCQKEFSLETGVTITSAAGTLKDSLGNCLPDSVAGTFYDGVTPGDTNYVQIEVNVTSIGSYSIKTDVQNGFEFADSGFFNATGINIIKLKPIGTPILQIPTDFAVSFDSSVCSFTVNVKDSTGTGLGGGGGDTTNPNSSDTAWHFTAQAGTSGLTSFNGPIQIAKILDTVISSQPYSILEIGGPTAATGDTALFLAMNLTDTTNISGSFSTTTNASFYFLDAITQAQIYSADPSTTSFGVSITIVSYDSISRIVVGNYFGTAKDAGGNPVTISNGWFTAKIM